jgi:hypothetical protein
MAMFCRSPAARARLTERDEDRCANGRMQWNRNAVLTGPGKTPCLQFLDEHVRQLDVHSIAHPRIREFVVAAGHIRQIVEGARREQLDDDRGEFFGELLVNPALGFENLQRPLSSSGSTSAGSAEICRPYM